MHSARARSLDLDKVVNKFVAVYLHTADDEHLTLRKFSQLVLQLKVTLFPFNPLILVMLQTGCKSAMLPDK